MENKELVWTHCQNCGARIAVYEGAYFGILCYHCAGKKGQIDGK